MAHITFLNVPAHGHINPTLGLVKALVDRGDEVTYYATQQFRSQIELTGAEFRAYEDFGEFNQQLPTFFSVARFYNFILNLTEVLYPPLLEEIQSKGPDYIILDAECLWGRLVAEKLKIPAVCTNATLVLTPWMLTRLSYFAEALNLGSWTGVKELWQLQRHLFRFQRRFGLSWLPFPFFFNNHQKTNILFTSRYFHPRAFLLGKNYHFVGPSLTARPEKITFPWARLKNKKVIYVSLGTVFHKGQRDFFESCVKAFAQGQWLVVMSTGKEKLPSSVKTPPNFIIRSAVPQLKLLKKTSVFITHGGFNSVTEGLSQGVALILVPQMVEQRINADRVVELGAGIKLEAVTAQNLRKAVRKLMTDSSYKANIQKIIDSYQRSSGIMSVLGSLYAHRSSTVIKH